MEELDTSGFYTIENGELLFAPNKVLNKDWELHKEEKDSYIYPVNGWNWFDSLEDACVFNEIDIPLIDESGNTIEEY